MPAAAISICMLDVGASQSLSTVLSLPGAAFATGYHCGTALSSHRARQPVWKFLGFQSQRSPLRRVVRQ